MTTVLYFKINPKSRILSGLVLHNRKKWSRFMGLSALAVAVSACQSIPSVDTNPIVAQPNIPLSPGEGYEYAGSGQPSSLAAVRWQDYYIDPKLKTLIQLGLENNKEVRQAVLAIQKAQAQYRITDLSDSPTLGLNGDYSRGATNRVDRNPGDTFSVGLGLSSYELDFWGKVSSLKDQALQNYLATNAAKDTAQVSLIANIAKSYVNLSYQLKQLELANSTLEGREKSLFITQARFEAGIDSKAPFLQSSASLESARIAVLNAQNEVLKARNALKYLIGTPITDDMLPDPAIPYITSPVVLNAGLPSDLLRYRPDILQAEYNLKAAGANIDVARAAYYPSISLTGNLGYRSGELTDLFKASAGSWSFGPSISLPLFDAGQRDANYEVAQIERDQALANYESTIEEAFKEVNDVLIDRAILDARTQSEYRLQDHYQGLLDISDARYKAQVDDYLAVLDAERSLFSTQQSILRLEQERLNNQIDLYRSLGGGANLSDPIAIPTPNHRNLINILDKSTDEEVAREALEALSTPRIISPGEAYQIAKNDSLTLIEQTSTRPVDLTGNDNPDVYLTTIETTEYPAGTQIKQTDGEVQIIVPDKQ